MTEETKSESIATEPVVSEPIVEPTPVPEPYVEPTLEDVESEIAPQPTPEAMTDTATAQPVEPLDPEPVSEPSLTPEPIQEPAVEIPLATPNFEPEPLSQPEPSTTTAPAPAPEPQVIVSAFPISRARELLIKARKTIQFRKRRKLEKIMGMFLKQASITNDDVQKLVYVSDATATRYLQQLEREGRIKKENAGKYLSYSRM